MPASGVKEAHRSNHLVSGRGQFDVWLCRMIAQNAREDKNREPFPVLRDPLRLDAPACPKPLPDAAIIAHMQARTCAYHGNLQAHPGRTCLKNPQSEGGYCIQAEALCVVRCRVDKELGHRMQQAKESACRSKHR